MAPSLAHYTLADYDIATIPQGVSDLNVPAAGDVYPLLITRTFKDSDAVNGRVFLDGQHDLWVCSRSQGDAPGEWFEADGAPEPAAEPEAEAETAAVEGAEPDAAAVVPEPEPVAEAQSPAEDVAPEGTEADSPPQDAPAPAADAPEPEAEPVPVPVEAAGSEPDTAATEEAPEPTPPVEPAGPTEPAAAPVPGVTPGHPVDATTGEPLDLTPEQHEALAGVTLEPAASGEPVAGVAGDSPPAEPEATDHEAEVAADRAAAEDVAGEGAEGAAA